MLEQIEYRHFKTIITKNGFVFENSTFYRLQDDYKYVYIYHVSVLQPSSSFMELSKIGTMSSWNRKEKALVCPWGKKL